ncbi:MAG: HlyD family secretion protein [Bacteroidales bacterium]|jgi:HlyD family secretion protein|nr:HlyD family secretion protein [Bacteroidales bacterium]
MGDITKMEIRSEELDAILGKTPSRLILNSTSVILGFIVVILIGAMLFPYPEKIDCGFIITSSNPPIQLFSQAAGQITLYVKDKEAVKKAQVLALILNPADLPDVLWVERMLDSLITGNKFHLDSKLLKLGELTSSFLELEKSLMEYDNYIELDLIPQKIQQLNKQIQAIHHRKDMLMNQLRISEDDLQLIKREYDRDSSLFAKGVISVAELDKSKSNWLQKKNSYIDANIACKNDLIQIEQLRVNLLDLETEQQKQLLYLNDNIQRSIELLKTQIKDWKKRYAFLCPHDGITSLSALWSDNQWVMAGDPIMTILPENEERIIGRMEIPIQRSGKVKPNQDVMLKLSNYPYMEYGVIHGKIKSISLVPYNDKYIAEIEIPSLTTNYKYTIPFSQQMEGTASIIIKDLSLFERFIQPVMYSLKGHKRL